MLTKDDGMIAMVDIAITLVEFLVNLISGLLSGDISSLSDINLDLSAVQELFGGLLG